MGRESKNCGIMSVMKMIPILASLTEKSIDKCCDRLMLGADSQSMELHQERENDLENI